MVSAEVRGLLDPSPPHARGLETSLLASHVPRSQTQVSGALHTCPDYVLTLFKQCT